MFRRVLVSAVAGLTASVTMTVGGVGVPPVAAAPQPLELTMIEGGGELLIRDAEESFALETPTTVSGTLDTGAEGTGAITGASLSTPEISFEQPVLDGALTAEIDAQFTEVAPASGTGSVDPAGNVALDVSLGVDLHIDVESGSIVGDCVASPVNLGLTSTAPYDPETQRVTLADVDFTVPPVPVTAECSSTVADGVNESLAGPGHALTIVMEGAVEPPPEPGEESATTLSVSPPGGTRFGQPVTLTADVTALDPSLPDEPAGFVEFRDGETVLDVVALSDGMAELITDDIGLGNRSLTARYRGDSNFRSSASVAVAYVVSASPTVDVDLPDSIVIGADPVAFDVTVENPAEGELIENIRVDASFLNRLGGVNPAPAAISLETQDDTGAWNAVVLTDDDDPETALNPDRYTGPIGPATGTALAPGQTVVVPLRLSFPAVEPPTQLGRVDLRFDLASVDPSTGEVASTVSSSTGSFVVVNPDRVPTTVEFGSFFNPPVSPPVVRQGNTVYIPGISVSPDIGDEPTGSYSFEVDGMPVAASITFNNGQVFEPTSTVPIEFSGGRVNTATVNLPDWVGVGDHLFIVKYSGDHLYQPSSHAEPFTVLPSAGNLFECIGSGVLQAYRLTLQVSAQADLPRSVRAGSDVALGRFDVTIRADRGGETVNLFNQLMSTGPTPVGGDRLKVLEFRIGPDATGSAESAQYSGSRMRNPDLANPDLLVTFDGESGEVTIDGEPGDVVPVNLDRISIQSETSTSTFDIECVPVSDPITLGEVVVAGTTLEVAAPEPTRAGDPIGLNAAVHPAAATGVVEFLDGDTLIGLANVVDGRSSAIVDLGEGVHSLRARFRASANAPSTTSDSVEVVVLPELDCAVFAEDGNGAVVRLAYLELLLRCPEPAGYDFWVDELDDGRSADSFARAIAYTDEALGQVVDDAYRTMLGRDADPAGREFWIDRLKGIGRYDQLLAQLGSSAEFFSLAGSTNTGFVERVYQTILGRAADADGSLYWRVRLAGGESRATMIRTFAFLSEPLGVIVNASFDEILGRAPTGAEREAAIRALRGDGDRSDLYSQLIGTSEFFNRAQAFPNPED